MQPDEQPSRRSSDAATPRKVKIMAVDDDRSYLRYLEFLLGRAGFDVVATTDANAAIAQLRSDGSIDLLIVDLAMPAMDGIQLVQELAEDTGRAAGLYKILLTASDGTETKLRALDSGLDDCLTKNSPESEILAKLRSAARRLEMERRLHLENEELQALALTDELTGIGNRRALYREGEELLRAGRSMSAVLFDIDTFKSINDTYGHLAGDRVLIDVAAVLKEHTRYGDILARFGGDEFVLLLPDTDAEQAQRIAERISSTIRQLEWQTENGTFGTSASRGIATTTPDVRYELADLLSRSDQELYDRKRTVATSF
ncbi:MAG: two-component system, cell cycle response regulator [Acidobacteriota bacterium]|jgi:diguanylate cyclase (GGDEF)-like protein|nr:two-component system, cell cycle response regulator [Acidobacteriota bacterium]